MEPTAPQASGNTCPRCLQPVSPGARKCPDCGVYIPRSRLKQILMGLAGMLTLVFIIVLIVTVIGKDEPANAPGDDSQQSAPKPYKPPPLNP
jgi:hypothetical protein